MAQQNITIGAANAKAGDTYFDAFTKTEANFTELYSNLASQADNLIVINQESDFPVQDGTTITLAPDTAYLIGGIFSTAKTIIGDGSVVLSSGTTGSALLTYTGTGSMFKATNTRLTINDITVDCPNGTLLELNGSGSGSAAERMNLRNVVCANCVKVLDFDDAGAIIIDSVSMANVTGNAPFTFAGSNIVIVSLSRVGVFGLIASAVCYDLGTAVFGDIEIIDNIIFGNAAATVVSGLAGSANLSAGSIGMVSGSNFSAFTTPLSGITEQDARWDFRDNAGVVNSRNAADSFLTTLETVTIATQSVFVQVNGSNWQTTVSDRFTSATTGIVTYVGERDIEVKVSGYATVAKVGGGSDEIEVRFALNGTTLERSGGTTENASPTSVPLEALIPLTNGDEINFFAANNSSTSNIEVSKASLVIVSA